jgi:Family of unknown function (DUF5522)
MSDRDESVRGPNDASKGMGFSPSIGPAQSERTGSLELQPQVSTEEVQPLLPEDFYMEGPYIVFTAAYHLRRGSCCHSDCRHCPYK